MIAKIDKTNSKETYFKVFSNCIPVKGFRRSLICDLQKNKFDFIPNELFNILQTKEGSTIDELIREYGKENRQIINEYFEFLTEKEYIFWCEDKEELSFFPTLNMQWDAPSIISNAIIDILDIEFYNFDSIFAQLEELGCMDIQLRCFKNIDIKKIHEQLKCSEGTRIKSIVLFLKYDDRAPFTEYEELLSNHPRIVKLIIHSSPDEIAKKNTSGNPLILYIEQYIESSNNCGIINPSYFTTNIPVFTESQQHNTCLNRKISIDINGEIKNCPSMTKSYGNIKTTTLGKAIDKPGFKDLWYIHKDQIETCKDCEFRHICTDCRAFIKDSNNVYSKPLKCGYDPYTAVWAKDNLTNNPLYKQ